MSTSTQSSTQNVTGFQQKTVTPSWLEPSGVEGGHGEWWRLLRRPAALGEGELSLADSARRPRASATTPEGCSVGEQ